MINDSTVSPYLEKPVRTMHQICLEIAKRDGLPPPDCRNCHRTQICLMVERNHRRLEKKKFLASA